MCSIVFPRSAESIIEDIYHGRSQPYDPELLREFLKLLPEAEEVNNGFTWNLFFVEFY